MINVAQGLLHSNHWIMATSANLEKTTKPLESQSPESLHNRNTDSIVGFLVQCTSTVKNAKNHLLVYKIAFVAFELRFKKCRHSIFSRWVPLQASLSPHEDVKGKMVIRT